MSPALRRPLAAALPVAIGVSLLVAGPPPAAAVPNPAGFVNTLIGTSNNGETWPGGTSGQLTTFYTALYHALLHPNVFNDVNGQYMGMDQRVHTLSGGQRAQYANFSGWDVYRGQLQLITLLRPDIGSDIATSIFNHATQNGGVWDRWTHNQGGTHVMTGDPAHAALPSIYAFGGRGFDAAGALASMIHSATTVTAADLSRSG